MLMRTRLCIVAHLRAIALKEEAKPVVLLLVLVDRGLGAVEVTEEDGSVCQRDCEPDYGHSAAVHSHGLPKVVETREGVVDPQRRLAVLKCLGHVVGE